MIITDEKILRTACEDVLLDEASALIQTLETELAYSAKIGRPGIGLAAIQCAIPKKVAIVRLGSDFNINLVNATITKGYDEKMFSDEGCLSYPGRIENTMRYQEIVVSNAVYPFNFVATGLFAVVIQHEIDHLNGVLLPDRALPKLNKAKIDPNAPCLCGSGRRARKCCAK